jgi:DNA-binding transcriptional ArsR family regulator
MKKLVPIDKIFKTANIPGEITKAYEEAVKRKLLPIDSILYEIIQKNKSKNLKGKPKGISNSFCKLFILAELMGEKLTFEELRLVLRKELGYKQKRGLQRHLSELLEKGLIKKENSHYQLPTIDLEYVKKVHDFLVYNKFSEFEFYWLFEHQLPKDILAGWIEYKGKTLREKFAKGDKEAIEFEFETKMDLVSGSITGWMERTPKALDSKFLIDEVKYLNGLKKELEDFKNHPKISRKIKYKLEVLIEIMKRSIASYENKIWQIKARKYLLKRMKDKEFKSTFEKLAGYLNEASFSKTLILCEELKKHKGQLRLQKIDKIIAKLNKQSS